METLQAEISGFLTKLDAAIEKAMTHEVLDGAKKAIWEAVKTEVYDAYKPKQYKRKKTHGGLQDYENMEHLYQHFMQSANWPEFHNLAVIDMRKDEDTGRLVAPVVESGEGYDYYSPGPRPFHETAEARYAAAEFEKDLVTGLNKAGMKAHL